MELNRSNTAVLVIDVQNDVVAEAYKRDAVIANIATIVEMARSAEVPVIWVQHDDEGLSANTPGWEIVPELAPAKDEVRVQKNFRDSFQNTSLEAELQSLNIGSLIVTGAQTDFCVRWTLHSAQQRGYDTVLVADAHTTDAESPEAMPNGAQIVAHTNSIWASQADINCTNTVTRTAELFLN